MTRRTPGAADPAAAAAVEAHGGLALHVVAADAVPPTPWKNGGGVTRELLRVVPPGAADADWLLRISLADIAADGPFSPFAGVTRWFAVIEGPGVRLHWAAGAARAARELDMRPGDPPVEFDGADAPEGRLLDGPTRDLNVMVRADEARAELALVQAGQAWRCGPRACGVFAVQALTLRREGCAPLALAPRTLAWCADGDTRPWSIEPAAAAPARRAQTAPLAPLAFRIALLQPMNAPGVQ
jgi:environmental stress-induced protein Ves